MPIDVVAIVYPAPGKEARVEEVLTDLAAKVKQHEAGAIRYQPYKRTSNNEGTEFVVVERYADQAALDAHFKTDYFVELGKTIEAEGLLAKELNVMQLTPLAGGFEGR